MFMLSVLWLLYLLFGMVAKNYSYAFCCLIRSANDSLIGHCLIAGMLFNGFLVFISLLMNYFSYLWYCYLESGFIWNDLAPDKSLYFFVSFCPI
jgi:hypothetical protein